MTLAPATPLLPCDHCLVGASASHPTQASARIHAGTSTSTSSFEPTGDFFGDVWLLTAMRSADPSGGGGMSGAESAVASLRRRRAAAIRWTRLAGDGELEGLAGQYPPARSAHAAVAHSYGDGCEVEGCLVVFGGLDRRHRPLNDLWQFRVSSRSWHQLARPPDGQHSTPLGPPIAHGSPLPSASAWPMGRHQHSLSALVPPTSRSPNAPTAAPNASRHAAAAPVLSLFGGVSVPSTADGASAPSPLLDDGLWLFSLRRRVWLRVRALSRLTPTPPHPKAPSAGGRLADTQPPPHPRRAPPQAHMPLLPPTPGAHAGRIGETHASPRPRSPSDRAL